ncbi:MAG: hypothetical protein AAB521_03195 [Patescibacteria group bacterium]
MRGPFNLRVIASDKIILRGSIITFLIILLSLLFIILQFRILPPYVPIFNQLPWGEERLGTTLMIFLPVIAVAFVSFVNIFVSAAIYTKSQIISRMLTVSSILSAFLSFLFVVRTIQLIT